MKSSVNHNTCETIRSDANGAFSLQSHPARRLFGIRRRMCMDITVSMLTSTPLIPLNQWACLNTAHMHKRGTANLVCSWNQLDLHTWTIQVGHLLSGWWTRIHIISLSSLNKSCEDQIWKKTIIDTGASSNNHKGSPKAGNVTAKLSIQSELLFSLDFYFFFNLSSQSR